METKHWKVGEETLPESPLVTPPTPSVSSTSFPWWRGGSLPLGYGFLEVAWSISLYVLHCFRTTWDAYMIVVIVVIPLWWIFCFMRCQFSLCAWCIYRWICYLIHVCLFWSSYVRKNSRRECVCYSSNLVVVIVWWQKVGCYNGFYLSICVPHEE
jgi:hypothetical protein